MKKKWLAVALVVLLLTGSVLAAGADDFNAALTITDKDASVEVTVEDSQVLHDKIPVLTIPCHGKNWENAVVKGPDGKVLSDTVWNETERSVTFPVDKGGTYVIEGTEKTDETLLPDTPHTQTPETKPRKQFADVQPGQWYASAVDFVCEQGIMSGVSEDHFAPEQTLTRAMVVQVLYNMTGKTAAEKEAFSDVTPADWYYEAVSWAAENQVVNGVGDGRFAPNQPVTREQLAAILWRYAKIQGKNVTRKAELSKFADADTVSAYAKDAMQWACGAGLINGMDGRLVPQGHATRAQAAAILMRFAKL